ncbi:ribonucleoside-triphosphate reductase [Thermus phage phiLo]|nr:ribonucleoside-triphosphate reductase [Thermus phage phiLo]
MGDTEKKHGKHIPWGPIGEVVYLRTYSRWKEEEGRRETWEETVRRVVDYSSSLLEGSRIKVQESEKMVLESALMNLQGFTAGRTLWIGGSPRSKEFPLANYNCSFLDFKEPHDVYEAVILLMSGSGVGFRVTEDNIASLNRLLPLKDYVEVEVEPYNYVGKPRTKEHTEVHLSEDGQTLRMVVGDSREGWAEAFVETLKAFSYTPEYKNVKKLVVNVDHVRPLGERLSRFGGYASGPEVLVEGILDAQKVVFRNPVGSWTQTKALDIMNLVGRTVVAGGTRRCLPAGTPVLTEHGPKPIEEVAPGDKVLTSAGFKSVVERIYQGSQEVIEIKTELGTLRCTPNHKVAVFVNGGGIAWVEARKLQPGSSMLFYAYPWSSGKEELSEEGEVTPFSPYLARMEFFINLLRGNKEFFLETVPYYTRLAGDDPENPENPVVLYYSLSFTLEAKSFLDPKASEVMKTLGVGVGYRGWRINLVVPPALIKLVEKVILKQEENKEELLDMALSVISEDRGYFIPAKVVSVSTRGHVEETYDLSVADYHMFVASGFLVHNSAQIALGDSEEFAQAKTGSWWQDYPWRTSSNNSILFFSRPTVSDIEDLLHMAMQYGEPGFINGETASMRRENFRGVNPCSEILLDDSGVCNLATLVLPRFIGKDGKVDYSWMFHVARALTRHAIRIALLKFPEEFERWNLVQERDRLIGISFTGYGDFVDTLNLSPNEQAQFLSKLRQVVHEEAKRYSEMLGIREPILKTTVKPEGTLSLLPGVSSGIHPNYARYYMRRVRMSKADAVAQALRSLGMVAYPAPETGAKTLEEAHTWVFEFPVASPAKRSQNEYTAIEQLERYKLAMEHYADHNVSITVLMEPKEIEEVARWIYDNWYSFVGVSFLRKSKDVYPLMPLEEITEEQYRVAKLMMPDLSRLNEIVDAIERGEYKATDNLDPSCASGACPVR